MPGEPFLRSDAFHIWITKGDITGDRFQEKRHQGYGIIYNTNGDLEYQIHRDKIIAEPDSILLVPPNTYLSAKIKSSGVFRYYSIHFSPEIFENSGEEGYWFLQELFKSPYLYYSEISKTYLTQLIDSFNVCQYLERPVKDIALKCSIITISTHIYLLYQLKKAGSFPRTVRVLSVVSYITNNLENCLPISTIAKRFNISRLNAVFGSEMGVSLKHYIHTKRLEAAKNDIQKGLLAEEAAFRAGYNDYSGFYRAFKSLFGVSPKQASHDEH
jgi:AraC-like DNA-binding protein